MNESIEGGVWKTSCLRSSNTYFRAEASFVGGQYYSSLTFYADSTCTTPSLSVQESGTYALTGNISTGFFPKSKIDFTLGDLTATSWSSSTTNQLNSASYCGISNWVSGQSRSVLGLICDSQQMPQAQDKRYNIYGVQVIGDSLTGVQAGDLLMGSLSGTYDGTSEGKRPVNLSSSLAYRR